MEEKHVWERVLQHVSRIATVTTSSIALLDGLGPSQWGGMAMLETYLREPSFHQKVPDWPPSKSALVCCLPEEAGPSFSNCYNLLMGITLKYVYVYALVCGLFT